MVGEDLQTLQSLRISLPQIQLNSLTLPQMNRPSVSSIPRDSDIQPFLHDLVELRACHQTEHASQAIRTGKRQGKTTLEGSSSASLRCRLIQEFHAIIKAEQSQGIATGSNRSLHWTGATITPGSSGNAGNTETVAKGNATQVSTIGHNSWQHYLSSS